MSYSYNELSSILEYDPKTGGLKYSKLKGRVVDSSSGYVRVTIKGKRVELSIPKVCWVLAHKELPKSKVYLKGNQDSASKYSLSNLTLKRPVKDSVTIKVIHNEKYKRACVQWTIRGKRRQRSFTCSKKLNTFLSSLK